MEPLILEGTFVEVQRRLSTLPVQPDDHLRIVVTQSPVTELAAPAPFVPTEYRSGLPFLPHRKLAEPLTQERVRLLSEDDDAEVLRAYRIAGR